MSVLSEGATQAVLGTLITHNEEEWYVVRIVESSAFFQTSDEAYMLNEKYVELRKRQTGEVGFKIFSQIKHPFTPELFNLIKTERRGLDPKIWRKF